MTRRPNLIIAGAQKSGTSSLHRYLSAHPDIFMSRPKELHYFDREPERRKLNGYLAHFENRSEKVLGESTPFYMNYPGAAADIAQTCPDARIVFVLRDPADRAYSHYWHEVKKGWEQLSFEAAIARESERLAHSTEWWRHYSYLARGRYATFVRDFLDLFGKNRIMVVYFEDMAADPRRHVEEVCRFVGVEPELLPAFDTSRVNASRLPRSKLVSRITGLLARRLGDHNYGSRFLRKINLHEASYPPMAAETRRRLGVLFAAETAALAEICARQPPWKPFADDDAAGQSFPDWGVFGAHWRTREQNGREPDSGARLRASS